MGLLVDFWGCVTRLRRADEMNSAPRTVRRSIKSPATNCVKIRPEYMG